MPYLRFVTQLQQKASVLLQFTPKLFNPLTLGVNMLLKNKVLVLWLSTEF